MKKQVILKLERPARKGGGDRYQEEGPENGQIVGQIYVQQRFSRPSGQPEKVLLLTLEHVGPQVLEEHPDSAELEVK